MKKGLLWMALAALFLPLLARTLWFYRGIAQRPEIATPDYRSFTVPQPAPQSQPVAQQEVDQAGGIVLVDYLHGNQFQPAEIQSLREAVEQRGGRLDTLTDAGGLIAKLKYANALVVISPSYGFADSEIQAITNFVGRGGRLAVFADATRGLMSADPFSGTILDAPDSNAVNPLLANFGISVNNDYLYNIVENEGNFRNVFFGSFGKDELTFGLKQVAFYGTHSVESDAGQVLFFGADQTFSSITDAHNPAEGGAALSDDGNVVAFGDFTFMTSPYDTVCDNGTLITNIADFLLGGEQEPSLAAFPFVFSQPDLQVYAGSDVKVTAATVAVFAKLQTTLQAVDVNMKIETKLPPAGDKLILSTFSLSDDVVPLVEPFNLKIDEGGKFIKVPGFGDIVRSGNGIILFEPGEEGNTIILLAETKKDVLLFLSSVSSGSLQNCVLQSRIGVCGMGSEDSYSEEEETEATPTPTPGTPAAGSTGTAGTEQPTPTPVATGVG